MTALSVTVTGGEAFRRALDKVTPSKRPIIWRALLGDTGAAIVRSAREESMIGGGRFRGPPGPRGGLGKFTDAPPHPTKLTSRTGIGRSSIRMDTSGLPRSVEVGSDRKYMAIHELVGVGRAKTKRPWLEPAIERTRKRSDEILLRAFTKATR